MSPCIHKDLQTWVDIISPTPKERVQICGSKTLKRIIYLKNEAFSDESGGLVSVTLYFRLMAKAFWFDFRSSKSRKELWLNSFCFVLNSLISDFTQALVTGLLPSDGSVIHTHTHAHITRNCAIVLTPFVSLLNGGQREVGGDREGFWFQQLCSDSERFCHPHRAAVLHGVRASPNEICVLC